MSAPSHRPRQAAIVGYSHSPIVRHSDLELGALTIRTVREAITDAGLTLEDIDGFTTGALFPSSGGHAVVDGRQTVTADWLVDQLRVQPRWLSGFQGIGQICGSVILAANAIEAGAADYVVVHRSMYNPPGRYNLNPMREAAGVDQWTAPHGYWGALAQIALPYMEYMQRYGATREDMATVVVGARNAGSAIPWSHWYGRPIEVEDYLAARMVSDPMSILDCDIPITGVAAFVMTTAERARDLRHRPVHFAGFAQGRFRPENGVTAWSLDAMMEGGRDVARRFWASSGLGPDDVDVPQVYDAFSPFVYLWLESLGYCGEGEAHQYVKDPAISPGITFRTGGGALGNGRMHGVPQMLECYLQLSGRAGTRQLDRAEVGFACQASPNTGGIVAYTA